MPNALLRLVLVVMSLWGARVGEAQGAVAPTPVSILAEDGGTVLADVYGSGEVGIVLVHGGRFDRTSWVRQASRLAAEGFRALALDLRAAAAAREGKAGSCLYDASCLSKDVIAGVKYLQSQGVRRVFLVGGSLGGGAVAQASNDLPPGTIEGIVLLAHMSIANPQQMQGRKLFIVAKHDSAAGGGLRIDEVRRQFERAKEPKTLRVVDGSAHAQSLFETKHGPGILNDIIRFIKNR